jgi:hypothetical protein
MDLQRPNSRSIRKARKSRKMTTGTVECSVGYSAVLRDPHDPEVAHLVAELGPSPGLTHDGESYDLIQTDITPNHLAIVDQARAGAVARLRAQHRVRQRARVPE